MLSLSAVANRLHPQLPILLEVKFKVTTLIGKKREEKSGEKREETGLEK